MSNDDDMPPDEEDRDPVPYDPNELLDFSLHEDPNLIDVDEDDDPLHGASHVTEFLGTIQRRPDESDRAFQTLCAVARLRPHTQRDPRLPQRMEIPGDTLRTWRSRFSWTERLTAWNDVRAAIELQGVASQRHDAQVAIAGLARVLAVRLGQRVVSLHPEDIAPNMIPNMAGALAKLMTIVEFEDEITDGLLTIGDMTGGAFDDGLDSMVDLAAIDPELSARVLSVFGRDNAEEDEALESTDD
jgi:hypothetical protein